MTEMFYGKADTVTHYHPINALLGKIFADCPLYLLTLPRAGSYVPEMFSIANSWRKEENKLTFEQLHPVVWTLADGSEVRNPGCDLIPELWDSLREGEARQEGIHTGSFILAPCTQYHGLSWGSVVEKPPANAGDMGLIFGSLEKEMTTHSSILAWEIPWTEEPGGLQSTGSIKSWTKLSGNNPVLC